LDFVKQKKAQYGAFTKGKMSIFEVFKMCDAIVDDSDPDTDLSQLQHALQTSEAARGKGAPRWMVFAAFVHDLGKVLACWGEPQWCVVGDTHPVGCKPQPTIVFHKYFKDCSDSKVPEYTTDLGVYTQHCGLDNVHLSWGHDEYLWMVTKKYIPLEAQYVIRFHSFYSQHRENSYDHLLNDQDQEMFAHVRAFNEFDLYSKSAPPIDWEGVKDYYTDLINEFLPEGGVVDW